MSDVIGLSVVIKAIDQLTGPFKNMAAGIISGLPGPVKAVAAIGAAAAAVGVQAVKMAGNFQAGTTTLVTGAGESLKNIDMVRQGILGMAVDTGTTTKQLTSGMFMIESAGFHGADGLNVLKAAAMGAKVGNADLGIVSNATTTIMTDFGLKSSQASVAVNSLIATVSNGKTTMGALSGALAQILPTASAAKVGLNDTMAAMATMTGEGIPAANAATYLRQTIVGLVAPSKGTVTALKGIGLSATQVADEMKVSLPAALQMITDHLKKKFPEGSAAYVNALKNISGGAKTMQGMLDLTGQHLQTFKDDVVSIAGSVKSGGNAITGWSQVQGDFNFKIDQAKEVLETLMIKIGTLLLPIATKAISIFLGLGNVLKYVVDIFRSLNLTGFSEAWQAVSQEVGYVITKFSQLGSIFSQVGTDADPIANLLGNLAHGVLDTLTNVLWGLSQAFILVDNGIENGKGPLGGLRAIFLQVKSTIAEVVGIVGGTLKANFQFFGQLIQQIGGWFKSSLLPAIQAAMPGFQALAGAIITQVVPAIFRLWSIGQGIARNVIPLIVGAFEFLAPIVVRVAGVIMGILGGAIRIVVPIVLLLARAIGGLVNFFTQTEVGGAILKAVLITIGTVMAAMAVGAIASFIASIPAIVAGFAAWAAGAWAAAAGMIAATWPILAIVGVVVGVIALVILAVKHWGAIAGWLAGVWNGVKSFFVGLWNGIVGLFKGAVAKLGGAMNVLKIIAIVAFAPIALPILGIIALIQHWGQIMGWIGGVFKAAIGGIGSMVSGALSWFTGLFQSAEDKAKQAKIAAEMHTLQMKDQAIKNSEQMAVKSVANLSIEARGVEQQLEHAKTASERKRLEMKLASIKHAMAERVAVVHEYQMQREAIAQHMKQLQQENEDAHKNIFQHAWDWTTRMVQGVQQKFQGMKDWLNGLLKNLISDLLKIWKNISDGVQNGLGGLGKLVTGIWDSVKNAFKGAIDWIISGINNFIGAINGFKINIPAINLGPIHIGGGAISLPKIPTIPLLASGGLITAAGLAGIHDRGAEVVKLPTGAAVYPHGSVPAESYGGGGPVINNYYNQTFNIQSNDPDKVYKYIKDRLGRDLRKSTNLVSMNGGGKSSM